jgi:hypothetical protein
VGEAKRGQLKMMLGCLESAMSTVNHSLLLVQQTSDSLGHPDLKKQRNIAEEGEEGEADKGVDTQTTKEEEEET